MVSSSVLFVKKRKNKTYCRWPSWGARFWSRAIKAAGPGSSFEVPAVDAAAEAAAEEGMVGGGKETAGRVGQTRPKNGCGPEDGTDLLAIGVCLFFDDMGEARNGAKLDIFCAEVIRIDQQSGGNADNTTPTVLACDVCLLTCDCVEKKSSFF